jgi:hypothetical protein
MTRLDCMSFANNTRKFVKSGGGAPMGLMARRTAPYPISPNGVRKVFLRRRGTSPHQEAVVTMGNGGGFKP